MCHVACCLDLFTVMSLFYRSFNGAYTVPTAEVIVKDESEDNDNDDAKSTVSSHIELRLEQLISIIFIVSTFHLGFVLSVIVLCILACIGVEFT
jgi:hypothetical protein